MKIEIKIPDKFSQKKEYPYLGRHENGTTVLFVSDGSGILIEEKVMRNHAHKIGMFKDDWFEVAFRPLPVGSEVTFTQE